MTICPHVIRTIEDWACKKATSPFARTPRGRATKVGANGADGTPGESPLGKTTDDREVKGVNDPRDRVKTPKTAESAQLGIQPTGPGPRAATQAQRHRSQNAVLRAVLPTNKAPIRVRVLTDETPQKLELKNPHSPLANVSPAIIPIHSHFKYRSPRSQLAKGFETNRSKYSSDRRAKSFKLGYSSFY